MSSSKPTSDTEPSESFLPQIGPQPAFIQGEDARRYEELLARVSAALAPRDIMEEMWIRDVVDLAWEVCRLRRMKANLLRVQAWQAVQDVLRPLVRDPDGLAEKWCARDQAAVDRVGAVLRSAGLSMDTVMAATLRNEIDWIERIDAMVTSAELRRSTALRQIEQYRASFAEKLREAIEDAGHSDSNPAGIVPGAIAEQEAV